MKYTWKQKATIAFIGCILLFLVGFFLYSKGYFTAKIELNGEQKTIVEAGSEYKEEGAFVWQNGKKKEENIIIQGTVDPQTLGTYTITYTCMDTNKSVTREVNVEDHTPPIIEVKKEEERIFVGGTYDEEVTAYDTFDLDLTSQIEQEGTVDNKKQGVYTITYRVKDQSGNQTTTEKKIEVLPDPTQTKIAYDHDSYDNTSEQWWFEKSKEHSRNKGAQSEEFLKQYDAFYQGKDEKVIYLTFDEGGVPNTYVKEIAQVLNEQGVQATFFFTLNYIRDHVDFMKELIENGHLIANHSWHHYDMTALANATSIDDFVKEITQCEKTYYELLGQPMEKIFRFPKGEASERSLKLMKDLGYRTYFWSHAYADFSGNVSKEKALQTMMDHYHNGAIYLLHPSNKGNYEAMETFIQNMKKLGYRFGLVNEIA